MDSARHVITRILNPRLMDGARRVIKRILNPRFLCYMASHGVASTIHEAKQTLRGRVAKPGRRRRRENKDQGLPLVHFSAQREPFLSLKP